MHLLDPAPFGRILPAMVTPMKSDGSVDFDAAQKLAKQLVADGADGLVVNGTTGESPVTHMDEKVNLVKAVKEVVDVPVISGAGSNDTAHTVRMVEQTQEAGADAVLVVMPYYSRPSQDGIVGHYKAVDESAEKPIIVYDVPGRTGLKVKVNTYDRLAELEHVKAVKDATGDLAAAVEKQQRTGLAWYSGDDGLLDRKSTRLNSSHSSKHSFPTRRSSDLRQGCQGRHRRSCSRSGEAAAHRPRLVFRR